MTAKKEPSFHHMTYVTRQKIEVLLKTGHTKADIARTLGFSRAAITLEVKRGIVEQLNGGTWEMYKIYSADAAQANANMKATAKGAPLKIGKDFRLVNHIEKKVKEKYSPAAVLLEIQQQGLVFDTIISKSTIYNYYNSGLFLNTSRKDLPRKGQRKKAQPQQQKRIAFANALRPSISDRCKEIYCRAAFGHWEMDTVVGKAKGKNAVLLVLTERKTRYEIVRKIHRKKAKYVVRALDRLQKEYGASFYDIFKTITADNGCEFSDYEGMKKNDRTQIYYCHPYSSWERGSNENQNAMIRRWIPKSTDISKITHHNIQLVQDWINNYPRALYNSTAKQEFDKELRAIQVA